MSNKAGNAYGLTTLCPIINGSETPEAGSGNSARSFAAKTRDTLQRLSMNDPSPMASIPNTYLCRLFVLNNVAYQGHPAKLDQLRSSYLVFVAELYVGNDSSRGLDAYLEGMWTQAEATVRGIWEHAVGFAGVNSPSSFVAYIKKCQVKNALYFDGSNDQPLAEQLKGLYLKQEFSQFAFENRNKKGAELQTSFQQFEERTRPNDLSGPTWRPGASTLETAVINAGGVR